MGPMLLLVLGILSAVGLGLYQFGEQHRFDMVPDAKGGIFIIDRKTAAINRCDDRTCSLVGNGALPSQIMGNPAALMAVQGAIIGAPATVTAAKSGEAPKGMQSNIASSGAQPANDTTTSASATTDKPSPAAKAAKAKPVAKKSTAATKKDTSDTDGEDANSADEEPADDASSTEEEESTADDVEDS